MTSFYSVVQYVPDPIADERINVGVIVFGEKGVASHFLSDWRRVKGFGGEDTAFLQTFAKRVEEAEDPQLLLPALRGVYKLDEEALRKFAGKWKNSIQFTTPRASTRDVDPLLEEIARRFLREHVPAKREFRDRRAAATLAAQHVELALNERIGEDARHFLKRNFLVYGKLDEHRFDVSVANGKVYLAAYALSFEGQDFESIVRDVRIAAWTVDDVRLKDRELPIAVVAIPPKKHVEPFTRAKRIFSGLEATFVTEDEVGDWARNAVDKLPERAKEL